MGEQTINQDPVKTEVAPSPESRAQVGMLRRQCACGAHTPGGECDACRKPRVETLHRHAIDRGHVTDAWLLVHKALRSPGQPLDGGVREFMEPRFGHDFSRVRVHTDSTAAQSARAVHAAAYTVGQDVVFGAGQYLPETRQGQHLLAHELAHTLQQTPAGDPKTLVVESPDSAAETEAQTFAAAVVEDREAAPLRIRRTQPTLQCALGGGIFGGILGAIGGAALGFLIGGPVGAVIGGIAGAGAGAAAGHLLSEKEKDPKGRSALARIHDLLSTGILDWAVTDDEARAALEILRGLRPAELFETAGIMMQTGAWQKLRQELPPGDRLGLDYFTLIPLNPNVGYIMLGDTLKIEFDSEGDLEKEMSQEYPVYADGVTLPFLPQPVRVLEQFPQEAADRIAKAYIDALIYVKITVRVTPVKRGIRYAAFGPVTQPTPATSTYNIDTTPEGKRRTKLAQFVDYIKVVTGTDAFTLNARGYYYAELDKNIDAYKTPEDLWKWALTQASKPPPVSPLQPFLDLARSMDARIAIAPPLEQKRLTETLSRYTAWVSAHASDPDLSKQDPVKIWSQAYLNVFSAEMRQLQAERLRKLREEEAEKNWPKAVEKFDAALKLMMTRVWAVAPPRTITVPGEVLSEEKGVPVTVSYLVQPSDAERIIRDKIATEFMDRIVERMSLPNFANTTATEDFIEFLKSHPEEHKALLLTEAHPDTERFEDEVDIPAWQTALDTAIGFIPVVGNIVAAGEVIGGEDIFGHPMTTTERTILGVAILLPAAAKIFKIGKASVTVARLSRDYRLTEPEARALFRATANIAPGSFGAKLLGVAADDIRAGKAWKSPEKLKQLDKLLRDMGMTEKETARALVRPGSLLEGVEAQAAQVAQEELKAIGTVSAETETMLIDNPTLRKALAQNPRAARALTLCKSLCIPGFALPEQVRRVELFLAKAEQEGVTVEMDSLKEYLHRRGNVVDLDEAIDDLEQAYRQVRAGRTTAGANTILDEAELLEQPGMRQKKPVDIRLQEAEHGREFDTLEGEKYPHNQVTIRDKSGSPRRLDSYDPGKGEIISRKSLAAGNGQIANTDEFTMIDYFQEFKLKYPDGAIISDVPSTRKMGLANKLLKGKYILEVPVQNIPIPDRILQEANIRGITIRDINGKVY